MARKAKAKSKKKVSVVKKRSVVKSKKSKKTAKKGALKRKNKVLAIPKGYNSITPYLIVDNAVAAIEFYKKSFGAKVAMRMERPGGKIGHAELKIGDTKIMLADECPEMDARSPQAYGGSPVGIHLYVKNVDDVVAKAIDSGATVIREVQDQFYGDRSGTLQDPYGHKWHVSTHIEDVSPSKMKKREAELFANKS